MLSHCALVLLWVWKTSMYIHSDVPQAHATGGCWFSVKITSIFSQSSFHSSKFDLLGRWKFISKTCQSSLLIMCFFFFSLCSLKLASILSSMNYGTQIHGFQMAAHCPHCSISSHQVCSCLFEAIFSIKEFVFRGKHKNSHSLFDILQHTPRFLKTTRKTWFSINT